MLLEEIEDKDVVIPEQVSIDTTHLCRSTPAIMDDIKSNPDDQCRSTPLISVDRHPSQTDLEIEQTPKIAKERVCKSYDALVEKINWQLHRKSRSWQFPEVHDFRDLPSVKKVIDKAYAEEICLNDAVDLVYLECATILQSRLPEKLPDPVNTPTPSLRHLTKREAAAVTELVSIDTSHGYRSTPSTTDDTNSIPLVSVERHQSSVDRHPSQVEPEIAKPTKTVEERVYKPKVPYPKLPRHLRRPITAEKLFSFENMARNVPRTMSFKEALECRPLLDPFQGCRETLEEIETFFIEARSRPPWVAAAIQAQPLKRLTKREDPGKFSVPCSISGVEFKESLVDSGSSVNVMSRAIAERLRIDIKPAEMTLTFANSATSLPYGIIPDLLIKIGDCLVPTDFQVVEMSERSSTPLILGRPFMATVGALIDTPGERISFSYIDKEIFHKAIPSGRASKRISCVTMLTGETLMVDLEEIDDEDIELPEEVSIDTNTMYRSTPAATDGKGKNNRMSIDTIAKDSTPLVSVDRQRPLVSIDTRHGTAQKVKRRDKPKSDRAITTSHMTLTPQRRVGDSIEYKVKCKAIDDALSKVLKLNMHDHRIRRPRLNPPPPLPDPSRNSHHL